MKTLRVNYLNVCWRVSNEPLNGCENHYCDKENVFIQHVYLALILYNDSFYLSLFNECCCVLLHDYDHPTKLIFVFPAESSSVDV